MPHKHVHTGLASFPCRGDAIGLGKTPVCLPADIPSLSSTRLPDGLPPTLTVEALDDGDGQDENLTGTGAELAHEVLPMNHLRFEDKTKTQENAFGECSSITNNRL